MIKNIVKLTLMFAGLSSLALADMPLPKCFPCGKKAVSSHTVSHTPAAPVR
ncbi:MAG TPA: hypothetical protein VHD76_09690 [Bryobacteraceae bacterium]|jgi:hypothetical protein|nr:hypothetical protein [Bryobacteraceae bacterium]HVT93100.1 hypothetical protein [Bryobacteraceae bacterium]HVT93101.1 hypothetical protein [Bryobacteraceae bacterium]HWB99084.1 hypothetical protein [Bryobacteraceae bacterium]